MIEPATAAEHGPDDAPDLPHRHSADGAEDAVVIFSADGRIEWASPVLATALARSPEVLADSWLALVVPEDRDEARDRYRRAVRERESHYRDSMRVVAADGDVLWVDASVNLTWSAAGDLERTILSLRDVDAHVSADHALAASEERFRLAMDNSGIGMCLVAPEGRFLRVNAALCTMLGRDADVLITSTWQELTHPDDLTADLALVDELLAGRRETYRMVKRFLRSDGDVVWGDLSVSCVRNEDGSVDYFISQIVDVSEQKRASLMLEVALASMLDPYAVFGVVLDDDGTLVDVEFQAVNDAACVLLQRAPSELIGQPLGPSLADMPAAAVVAWCREAFVAGSIIRDEAPIARAGDGEPAWFDVRATRVDGSISLTWRDVSDRRRDAEELALREASYRLLADNAADVIVRSAAGGAIEWVSPSITGILGWAPDEVIGRRMPELMHPDDLAGMRDIKRDVLESGGTEGRITARFATADGGWRWMSDHGRALLGDDGGVVGGIDSLRDVQHEHDAAEALALSERHYRDLAERTARAELELRGVVDSLFDPWVLLTAVRDDDGRIVDFTYADANDSACAFNHTTREALIGARLLTLLPEHGSTGLFERYARVVETGEPLADDDEPFTNVFDGSVARFDNRAVRVGDGISLTWRDVTERYEARLALTAQAELDALTGLANRRSLLRRMEELAGHAPRTGAGFALLYCDLDHFKRVNDDFGHAAGDQVLAAVADRIASAVRDGDLIARLGGDEFVVLLEGVHDASDAAAVAAKVAQAVRRPVSVGGRLVQPQFSIGVSMLTADDDPQAALLRADGAMYAAKRAGRNRIVVDGD